MTLTIELPADVEARLSADAAAQGRAPEQLAAEAVAERYGIAPAHRFDPALINALREGIADGEAGREVDFQEYLAERRAARAARVAQSAGPPSAEAV